MTSSASLGHGLPGRLRSIGGSLVYERDRRRYILTPAASPSVLLVFDVFTVSAGVPHWRRTAIEVGACREDLARELGHGDPALEAACLRDLRLAAMKLQLARCRLEIERRIEESIFPITGSRRKVP